MYEVIRGNRHTQQTREGDAYTHAFTMYVDSQEHPIEYVVDERHTVDAFKHARAEILKHNAEKGRVLHAWMTRIDRTSTDHYRESVFEYDFDKWILH